MYFCCSKEAFALQQQSVKISKINGIKNLFLIFTPLLACSAPLKLRVGIAKHLNGQSVFISLNQTLFSLLFPLKVVFENLTFLTNSRGCFSIGLFFRNNSCCNNCLIITIKGSTITNLLGFEHIFSINVQILWIWWHFNA